MNKQVLQSASFIVSQKQRDIDLKMVKYDLWGTIAHVLMLYKQNCIDKVKAQHILQALIEIEKEVKNQTFFIDENKGAQLTLEAKVIEKIGEEGMSMHTARSRNDQVAVTELLYLKDHILIILGTLHIVLKALVLIAQREEHTIMPGITHMQPAKPTTVGQWALAYCHALLRAGLSIQHYFELYDKNPLGAVEGYGTTWQIDRNYTKDVLGFTSVWEIPQDAISSRGIAQYNFFHAFANVSLVVSKLAEDLLLFSTYEFQYIVLGENVAQRMHPITGSSVMAQKRNPDILELMRSVAPQTIGIANLVGSILDSLPMGYNRDSREVKEYMELGMTKTQEQLIALQQVLETLQWNKERMHKAVIQNYSMTTDMADYLAQKTGISYRLMYKIVGQTVAQCIKENKSMLEITAEDLMQQASLQKIDLHITQEDIKYATQLESILAKRYPKSRSKKQLKYTKKHIASIYAWIVKHKKIHEYAYKKTHEVAYAIAYPKMEKGHTVEETI